MPPVFTNVVDGNLALWAGVQANIDAARNWVNDIPDADIAVGGIRREHLVRPQLRGFPVNGVEGGVQAAYFHERATLLPDTALDPEWSANPRRLTIIPTTSDGTTRVIRTGVAGTFYVWADNWVSVVFTADMQVRSNSQAYRHPFGAGAGVDTLGGYFSLHFFDVTGQADNELVGSRRYIYPTDDTGAGGFAHEAALGCYANRHLTTAGFYEVQLCYHIDAATSPIEQIDLSRIQLHIEVL